MNASIHERAEPARDGVARLRVTIEWAPRLHDHLALLGRRSRSGRSDREGAEQNETPYPQLKSRFHRALSSEGKASLPRENYHRQFG
jgi:hypothetical protein